MTKKFLLIACFLASAALTACDKNPVDRIINPAAANTTGIWSGKWTLYDDEVKTAGAIMLFDEGASLDFNSTDNPHSGGKCIRYSWNGSPVLTYKTLPAHPTDYLQSDFTGFSLICAKSTDEYFSGTRNLSLGGYNQIKFWARGSLNASVYLRVEANSNSPVIYKQPSGAIGVWMGTVTPDWTQYSLKIDNTTNNLAAANDFIKVILRYDEDGNPDTPNTGTGNGGTVFLDDIELSK